MNVNVPDDLLDDLAARIAGRLADTTANAAPATSPWLDAQGAATHLSTTKRRMYDLAQQGRVPCHREGTRLLFDRRELDEWVRSGDAARLEAA